jgi:ATP-dependent Clp endopeptidase proteolytic subunit ClpP
MNYLTIENKAAKVKLNDHVDKISVDKVIEEISKVYGMKAVENHYAFGEIVACADNAVDTLEIEIHSGGGSVFEGGRIYNELKSLRERGVYVTARINTLAASMGSVIAMGADKVEIASNGKIMIHEASGGAHGDAETLARYAVLLEEISDDIAAIYAEKTGKSKEEMRALMKKETWMSAKQAVEMGFADEIFDTKRNVMSILDKFRPDAALTEKVQGLEASLQSAQSEITDMTAALTERTSDLENALTELAAIKAGFTELATERDTLAASLTEAQSKVTALEADLVTANNLAEVRAAEIVAQAGIVPVEVIADENLTLSNEKTLTEFNQLTPADRMTFVRNGGKIIN